MYKIVFHSQLKKDLKQLPKQVVYDLLEKVFPVIKENPYSGEKVLNRKNVFKFKYIYKKVHYRIAYLILNKELIIIILKVGSRENFYKKLFQRI